MLGYAWPSQGLAIASAILYQIYLKVIIQLPFCESFSSLFCFGFKDHLFDSGKFFYLLGVCPNILNWLLMIREPLGAGSASGWGRIDDAGVVKVWTYINIIVVLFASNGA